MKKLLIAALLFVGIAGSAQEKREKLTPEQRTEKKLQKLTSELNLDANQQAQVKQLLTENNTKAEKFKEARKDRKDSNTKPTAEEKAAFKKQMEDEVASNDAKMKSILKADQYTKWKALQEEKKDKMREKMKERKEKI